MGLKIDRYIDHSHIIVWKYMKWVYTETDKRTYVRTYLYMCGWIEFF